jgi:hypothetical protein
LRDLDHYRRHHRQESIYGLYVTVWFLACAVNLAAAVAVFVFS